MRPTSPAATALCLILISLPQVQAQTINSNTPVTGDAFTNAGSSNQGQAINTSPWVYNNTRQDGVVGIDTAFPQSGNGSLHFSTPNGNSKADAELLGGPLLLGGNYYATTSLGKLSELTSLSYDWYRDSSSTVSAALHPAIRLIIDADGDLTTLGDRGNLIFERAYNSLATPTDMWITDNVFNVDGTGTVANLWSSGSLPYPAADYQITLSEWMSGTDGFRGNLGTANAVVLGISVGAGSGWSGTSNTAVDNVTVGFNGASNTYNFEVAPVPEPSSFTLTFALLGLLTLRRRR